MDRERRQSKRVSTRLPLQWQIFPAQPSGQELQIHFGLTAGLAQQAQLAELGAQIQTRLQDVTDAHVQAVLSLIDKKLDLVSQAISPPPVVPTLPLVLTADGFDVGSENMASIGDWIGMHLVLEDGFSLLASARITRVTKGKAGFTVGAEFRDLDQQSARRVARYVMRLPSSE